MPTFEDARADARRMVKAAVGMAAQSSSRIFFQAHTPYAGVEFNRRGLDNLLNVSLMVPADPAQLEEFRSEVRALTGQEHALLIDSPRGSIAFEWLEAA